MNRQFESDVLDLLGALDALIVGFSGGVDSAVLSDLATEALGDRALIVTAVSPSLPQAERARATQIAAQRGWRHREVETDEIDRPEYVRNSPNRCFHCRVAFFEALESVRSEEDITHVALGTIADDLGGHRPGIEAARQHGVLRPLADVGLSKDNVRDLARSRGLEVWDKPASACLSSRIPYGTPVTRTALTRIESAETVMHELGFAVCRVRDHDGLARVEVPSDRVADALGLRETLVERLRDIGYDWVTLDMEGFRSGSLNRVLPLAGNHRPNPPKAPRDEGTKGR